MSFISKIFKKNEQVVIDDCNTIYELSNNEILDTSSKELLEKFKHNLKVLVKETKENKKVKKFVIVGSDIYFPYDYVWRVKSKNTVLDKQIVPLTSELKNKYAFQNLNADGNSLLLANQNKMSTTLSNIDENKFKINSYVKFKSTKHFAINTLYKEKYENEKNKFTIIDDIDNFIKSGYAYSLSFSDSFIDVSHVGLEISNRAVILIEKDKYDNLIKDLKISNQLSQRKVIIYKGDELLALNMVLTELGVLPSRIDKEYYDYDEEINTILDENLRNLAEENNISCDMNQIDYMGLGHFSSYFDDMNNDYDESINNFVLFLQQKLPEYNDLITLSSIKDFNMSNKIIDKVGVNKLVSIIEEYNNLVQNYFNDNYLKYINDRNKIDENVNKVFKSTNNLIDLYYQTKEKLPIDLRKKIEENIIKYIQGNTLYDQILASQNLSKQFKLIFNKI